MPKFNPRTLTGALIIFMLGIEGFIQIYGLISGDPMGVRQMAFFRFGLHPQSPWYAYITYAFIHGGLFHVLMNMFVMAQIGFLVEEMMGMRRYALFSLLAALICGAGTLAIVQYFRPGPFVLVGYSGVIFGYIGFYVRQAWGRARDKRTFIAKFARRNLLLIGFVFVPLLFPQLGISGEAHLIGLLFGLVLGPLFMPRVGQE